MNRFFALCVAVALIVLSSVNAEARIFGGRGMMACNGNQAAGPVPAAQADLRVQKSQTAMLTPAVGAPRVELAKSRSGFSAADLAKFGATADSGNVAVK